MLKASRKDGQTVTPGGDLLGQDRIDGVLVAGIRPVLTRSGATIETYRADGPFTGFEVRQVNVCPLRPNHTSDWHMHRVQNDVVVPLTGEIQLGLYDDREDSPTKGASLALRVSPLRMAAVYIPHGVWHALKNAGADPASYMVLTDQMYMHTNPDDWRVARDEPALLGLL